MSGPDCVRVEFEFADGSVKRLTGTAARTWMDEANGNYALADAHGFVFAKLPWEVLSPPECPSVKCTCRCEPQKHGRNGCKTWYGDKNTGFPCDCHWDGHK